MPTPTTPTPPREARCALPVTHAMIEQVRYPAVLFDTLFDLAGKRFDHLGADLKRLHVRAGRRETWFEFTGIER
jgi:hypothetical protein